MKPTTVDSSLPVDSLCTWGDDEIREAIKTAQSIERFDPETAHALYAQAESAKRKRHGEKAQVIDIYDPIALYARVLKFYEGAISEERLDSMDYRRFFGYVREAELITEELNEQQAQRENTASIVNALPHAQEYQGETINLVVG